MHTGSMTPSEAPERHEDARDGSTTTPVRVRAMEHRDVPAAVRLHDRALSHGLYGQLGARFLTAYYRTFVDSPLAVGLVAEPDTDAESPTDPAGMLIGTLANRRHYDWVVRDRGPSMMLRGVVALATHPKQLLRFLRTRARRYASALWRRRRATPDGSPQARPGEVAVLTHMAVDRDHRGRGIGAALAHAFLDRARRHGAEAAELVTLGSEEGAGRFYERLGWRLDHTRQDWDGRRLCAYRHDLSR